MSVENVFKLMLATHGRHADYLYKHFILVNENFWNAVSFIVVQFLTWQTPDSTTVP